MADKTKPVSIRMTLAEIEQLQERAYPLSASVTGVARDLIRSGLAGGDNKALADRLMMIERRIVVIEQQGRDISAAEHPFFGMQRDPGHLPAQTGVPLPAEIFYFCKFRHGWISRLLEQAVAALVIDLRNDPVSRQMNSPCSFTTLN